MISRPCPLLLIAAVGALSWSFSGCQKPKIRTYLAPKDVADTHDHEHDDNPKPPAAGEEKPAPKITYQVPAGWQETAPNSVSVAAFKIQRDGAEASVNITPLPSLAGREAMLINMMRNTAGLPPLEDSAITSALQPVEIGGSPGQMFEVTGTPEGGAPMRMITAFVHQPNASWFYKLSGNEALVAAQKPVFVEFLKSVRVGEASSLPAMGAPAAPGTTKTDAPAWSGPIPAGWQQLAPGNMQVAKFSVPEQSGAKADVSVSVFPGDTGGVLANSNRWRKQLGLPEVDQAGLAGTVSPLDPALPEAVLVDLKNEPRALLGAMVPRAGQWWFFKLLGDAPAVAAAREAFIAFAKTEPPALQH